MKIKGYVAGIDTLHRNRWPVRSEATGQVIGEVVEHITIALDGPPPPALTDWSWELDDAEAERLGQHWLAQRTSTVRYASYDEAFETFAGLHDLAVRSTESAAREVTQRGETS